MDVVNDAAAPASPEAAAGPAVDNQHPWLGLDSFSEETRAYFYGREDEVAELARRIQRKLLTILFGQSGLGKTSILRAGIVPRLRPLGYCPVYVRIDYAADSPPPSEQIKAAIFRATQASGHWTQTGVAVEGESLWEFLHHRDDVLRDASGRTLIPLLIFDQFEEIFTLAQTDDFARRRASEFIADLADLVENRPPKSLEERIESDESAADRFDFARGDYRILIALREDYLAHLEGLKGVMPSVTQNRMRLARMTGAQALEAVVKPGGKLVNEEVAESIVRFTAGGAELRNAEVEPALLSLVCRELNNARIGQGRNEISADVLAGSRDTILAEFYERSLADQPPGVRQVIEDHLLTESGYRESLAEERLQKLLAAAGAAPGTMARLVDRRLLRVEERLDVRRVELTHDVLCPVVRASRDVRLEREARDDAERKLAAQRERERATRQALVRARQIAAGCAVLAVLAIGSAIFGYISTKRAQEAEAKALQTRQMAEAARGEAEKLIVYLLDDFYLELEPVGRLDIVAALSKRALDYYAGLPAELRTDETERNRALALVRYGAVLRTQSKLQEGGKALLEAVAVLQKLRAQGDQSEAAAVGLALGLISQARVLFSDNKVAEARVFSQQAVDVLRPRMQEADASASIRRGYGAVLLYHGFIQLRDDREEESVRTFEEARAAFRSIDDLKLADLPAAASFTEASAWEVGALLALGRNDDARRVGGEAGAVAEKILEQRPGHMSALRAKALIADTLGGADAEDLRPRAGLQQFDDGARSWEALLRIDPTNQIAWNNLANARMQAAFMEWRLGRPDLAAERMQSALAVEANTRASGMISRTLAISSGYLTAIHADLGNRSAAEAALSQSTRFYEGAIRDLAPDAFGRWMSREWIQVNVSYAIPVAAGDYAAVRRMATAAVQRLEQVKAKDASEELNRNRFLLGNSVVLADACFRLQDYAAAEKAIEQAAEYRKRVPKRTMQDARDESDETILAAMIAARLGKFAEAQQKIAPALKLHRELYRRPNDDRSQHVQLAHALYASALASPERKSAALAEAAAILEGLPAPMRQLVSTRIWRDGIAEEMKRTR